MNTDRRATALDTLMNAVLTRLELASHVGAASTDGDKVSHGKNQGNQPPRVAMPHLFYRREYVRRHTDSGRREVIAAALNELRSIRYARRHLADRETKEGRLIIGRDPRPAGTVAYAYGYTVRHVHRLRAEAREHDRRSVRRPDTLTFSSVLGVRAGSGP